jgi:UDP-N-acetylglucosamine 2-epimerase (non-hydrolysing)
MIVHTGQHYDYELSKAFFDCLDIPPPDYNLDVGSGTHGYQLGEMVKKIEAVLLKEKPDLVIVYGDANSTLAGALATVKQKIKLAHVEAGYRSYDRQMPEEVNRLLTDHVSDVLFAPTKTAVRNLRKENVQGEVYLTGDVMVDTLLKYKTIIEEKSKILDKLGILPKEYILVTVHRESNTEDEARLGKIIAAFLKLKNHKFVFPIHPRTRKALEKFGMYRKLEHVEHIRIIDPLNYLDFLALEKNALKIVTDSGGVQREAYIFGIPCVTLRNTTEVVETVKEGWNILTDCDTNKIIDAVENFSPRRNSPRKSFGKGDAAIKILDILRRLK